MHGMPQFISDRHSGPALTEREQAILLMSALGNSNKHIARRMNVSVRTVESSRTELRRKLGIGTFGRLEAMISILAHHPADHLAELLNADRQAVERQQHFLRQALI
jgi:DNA-binding NarL/FixJ family response regulator